MVSRVSRRLAAFCVCTALAGLAPRSSLAAPPATGATAPATPASAGARAEAARTATPIKHLVVIYDENVSFDHYFATYPNATNPPGEPAFQALPNTPAVNNLRAAGLLTNNPNFTNTANGADAANPFRLDRTQAATADQEHTYTPEQLAYDHGKADLFPKYTGQGSPGGVGAFGTKGQVMGYYDGNTVTALWTYAQHYAMSDAAYTDTYGPSTPGALEVVSGQTNGVKLIFSSKTRYYIPDGQGGDTLISDVDPAYDICSKSSDEVMIDAKNIGDLLNQGRVSWGGFMGGFNPDHSHAIDCGHAIGSSVVAPSAAYIPHHNWFQYFASTANPLHRPTGGLEDVGFTFTPNGTPDAANHEYDLNDFYAAVKAGNFPSVSYIKFDAYQDAHAGYSDPLDEQTALVTLINFLESQPAWKDTAIIVTYDDSDGWYDHAFTPPTRSSFNPKADQLDGPGKCGTGRPPLGVAGKPVNGRCGPGTRIPFLVISPYAKPNFVAHNVITQASVVRFIEDNWLHGKRLGGGSFDASSGSIMDMFDFHKNRIANKVRLNPATGEPVSAAAQS
jgi:phospholipase C